MATPVTSAQWVVSFNEQSLVNQTTYTITIANTVAESLVQNLARLLRNQGYVNVRYLFVVVLP